MKFQSMKNAILTITVLVFSSCVPQRLLEETKNKLSNCETELAQTKKTAQENEAKMAEMKEQMTKDQKALEGLRRDTGIINTNYRHLTVKYDKLNQLNEQLMDRLNKLLSGSEKENSKLSADLQATMEQLLKKQDELKLLEAQLRQREARVNELENILKQKDKAVMDLKKKLQDALFNFENKGLTIQQKNGKVYVSMEENLLFASGKTEVNEKGVEALTKLAKVLEDNPDINVMVEGHTDNVPMKGSGEIKDNWDLSVMRATSVTKIILSKGKIDPKRIISAGRGEHFPLDPSNTAEARRKNRRTEIILTPKLDELLKVLETN